MHPNDRMTEDDWQRLVVETARLHGWLVHHNRPGMNRRGQWATHIQGDPGFPDLVMVHPRGWVVFAELKAGRRKLTEHQDRWVKALAAVENRQRSNGVLVYVAVWRPSAWPRVEAILRDGLDG